MFQNLIYCPDCEKEVSIYAETCPNYGRPIKQFLEDHKIDDFSKGFICPKCGQHEVAYVSKCRRVSCSYCHTPYVQTKYDMVYLLNRIGSEKEINYNIIKECGAEDQFDGNLYDKRMTEIQQRIERERRESIQSKVESNQPHCPFCQSTNIQKIGAMKRMFSTSMFGIASKKIGKQWHCKNCGSDF